MSGFQKFFWCGLDGFIGPFQLMKVFRKNVARVNLFKSCLGIFLVSLVIPLIKNRNIMKITKNIQRNNKNFKLS